MTDLITLILSIFFLIRGAARGFLNSLLVPISIIAATIISIIYFQVTKQIITSLIIGLVGPLCIHLLLKFLLKTWAIATNSEIKPGFLSRLGGAIITFIWGWIFIIFALILIAVLPPWGDTLTAVHEDVIKSASYFFAKPISENFFASSQQNVTALTTPTANLDAKTLAEDPRFQQVLKDPEIQKEIDEKDFPKLISNPKIIELTRQIMGDPATMKKVLAAYSNQQENKIP